MKSSLAVVMAGALLGCVSVPEEQGVWKQAAASTVLVETESGLGTGVVINGRCVITAEHVVEGAKEIRLKLRDRSFSGKEVAHDSSKDISTVCADAVLGAPTATLGTEPATYDPVFTIGFPLGFKYILTRGLYQGNGMMTAECAPGNSGGGVFDQAGNYVGLVDAIELYRGGENVMAFAHLCQIIGVEDIRKFLTTNHIGYQHVRQ